MKKIAIFITLITVSFLNAQTNFEVSEEQIKRLTNENLVAGVSGATLHNGETIWTGSSGFADREKDVRFTSNTLTRIASIAKPMTAIAVLQLFEKGLIDLEAPIQKYVSDFPIKKEGEITVRHILNHSAGIKAYQSNKEMANTIHYETVTEAMNFFKDWEIIGAPGIEERYTTYGYVVLGVLIERVSGMTYEAYMQKNIWDKAGMTNTGVEKFGQHYENKSNLYELKRKGKVKLSKTQNDLSNRTPGGGLYSNVEDILKFGQAVLDYSLISEETSELMTTHQEVKYDGNPYALGWFIYQTADKGPKMVGHSGAQRGCTAQLMIIKELNLVTVVLTNTSGVWGDVIGASIRLIEDGIRYHKKNI